MIFDWLNVSSPFFWCSVGSIFLGAAVSRISRSALGSERWTFVYLYLTVAVAAGAAGVFVPGPQDFLDIRLAYFSAACVVLGFACFRFAVSVGVPLLLLSAVALAILGISLRGWLPLQSQSQAIGSVRVFDASASKIDLEVRTSVASGAGNVTGTLPSGTLAPVVDVLRFDRYFFFVADPVIYRLDGVSTSSTAGARHELPLVGATGRVPPIASLLPGVEYKRILGTSVEARTLQDYSVILDSSLDARLVEASS